MTEHCCHNMDNFTRTPEDRAKSGFWAGVGAEPPMDPPLVEYRPDRQTYLFGCVVLFYCPWCGAKLPEVKEPHDSVRVQIARWVDDDPQPGIVEFKIVDRFGREW